MHRLLKLLHLVRLHQLVHREPALRIQPHQERDKLGRVRVALRDARVPLAVADGVVDVERRRDAGPGRAARDEEAAVGEGVVGRLEDADVAGRFNGVAGAERAGRGADLGDEVGVAAVEGVGRAVGPGEVEAGPGERGGRRQGSAGGGGDEVGVKRGSSGRQSKRTRRGRRR